MRNYMNSSLKKGILFSLLTAIISGFSIYYNKIVVVKGVDPLIFNIIKNGGVAILLTLFLSSRGKLHNLFRLSKKDWIKLVAIAVIGGSIPFVLFFEGLRLIPATNATLIQKSLFIWVAFMAIPFLKEKLNIWQIVGFVAIAWSNLFLGGFTGFSGNRGEVLILFATLLWSVEYIIMKSALKTIDVQLVAWARMFLGSVILIAVAAGTGKLPLLTQVTTEQLWLSVGSILFLTAYVSSLVVALKKAPVTMVTCVLILATPITNILSAVFLTHRMPNVQIIQAATSLVGVGLILWFARQKAPTQAPQTV